MKKLARPEGVVEYERQAKEYERKLEDRQKAAEVWQDLFGRTIKEVPVSQKEACIGQQLKD